jgi:hypothetical protein
LWRPSLLQQQIKCVHTILILWVWNLVLDLYLISNQHNANILLINGAHYLAANLNVLYSLESTHSSGCNTFILNVWTEIEIVNNTDFNLIGGTFKVHYTVITGKWTG